MYLSEEKRAKIKSYKMFKDWFEIICSDMTMILLPRLITYTWQREIIHAKKFFSTHTWNRGKNRAPFQAPPIESNFDSNLCTFQGVFCLPSNTRAF